MNAQRNKKTSNEKVQIMHRGLICLFLLIMATVSNSYADVLIGSWEASTNEGWADHPATAATGWTATVYVDDPLVSPSIYIYDSNWSTEGSQSLRASVTGWNWFERIDVHTIWYDYSRIEFDIYAVAQAGSTATYAQVEKMGGSTETNGWFDISAAQFNIGLGGTGTHCTFDYEAAGYKTSTYFGPDDAYGSIIIAYNADAPVYMYIDNVRFVMTYAQDPSPADEATGVSLTPTLSWTAGECTKSTSGHNVYFGTDFNDVNDANTSDTTGIYLGDTNDPNYVITTPLTASTLYYWRVDEVNDTDGDSPWKSDVWSFSTLGNATITKCKIKAGKTQGADSGDVNNMKDSITISGTAQFPSDLNGITTVDVNIVSVDDSNTIIYQETDINFIPVKNKFRHSYRIRKYNAGAITSLKMDFVKNTFSLTAKNVDLTGLASPLRLDFTMGNNIISGSADETIINGSKKLIPTRLMRMYEDTLVVTKAKFKHNSTRASYDSLSVKGEIAVADMNLDSNEPNLATREVVFSWGDANGIPGSQTFTIPVADPNNFNESKRGHVYKCKKIEPSDANEPNALVTATINFDKCTFTLSVTKADDLFVGTAPQEARFGISFDTETGTFDQTADVNVAKHKDVKFDN